MICIPSQALLLLSTICCPHWIFLASFFLVWIARENFSKCKCYHDIHLLHPSKCFSGFSLPPSNKQAPCNGLQRGLHYEEASGVPGVQNLRRHSLSALYRWCVPDPGSECLLSFCTWSPHSPHLFWPWFPGGCVFSFNLILQHAPSNCPCSLSSRPLLFQFPLFRNICKAQS